MEGQWQPLWEDIIEQTSQVSLHKSNSKSAIRKHFLGALVLSQLPTSVRQVAASEIIDGQQRLLTLQVFLAAFRDSTKYLNDEFLTLQLKRLTTNPPPVYGENEQYKVWPTGAFQDDLKNVMEAGAPEALSPKYPQRNRFGRMTPPRPGVVEAYLYFNQVIRSYLAAEVDNDIDDSSRPPTEEEIKQRANDLYDAVLKYIQIVEIQLDAEDDPQVIFETLNYRGVPLEPSDLVRNYLFLSANRTGKDVIALYNKYWNDFDEKSTATGKFWKEKERQGRFFRSRLDLFFFHYLTYRSEHEIKMGPLYQEFKNWWEEPETRNIESELELIQKTSASFSSLLTIDDTTRFGVFAQRLRILDMTTIYPFLLWLCEYRDQIAPDEFDGILIDLESYVVRRAISRLTPKNYNRIFLTLLAKMSQAGIPNRISIQKELLALTGDSGIWPKDDEFIQTLITESFYDLLGPRRTRMVLTAIELASRTTKNEGDYIKLPINNNLTVEHIMPQGFNSNDWPYPNPDGDVAENLRIRRVVIHGIGNLTLLTQPLNSDVSNGPFRTKRPEITGKSLLVLNSYLQQFSDNDVWNEKTIFERSLKLTELAMKVWPYPKV